ncbi:hypothetical protein TIFTF001_009550 [Ficus carica]|uniref:DUF8039 domain-containing protein n=1 Tax=Ficus carica TaxID=3494 RepID=A0AA87ZNA8_FICCA|nr:hypothetical protein TIFTF001_009550 [Ficus carica]
MSQNTMEDCKKTRARRKNPFNPNADGKRRATVIKRVHMARKRGERIEVTFDEKGQPEGKHGDELMSWIGVLAREHMEYNTQESQGTFKSINTSDVLTQALSRPEHPGRIRGQSKFIKQSQYFNLNRSSNRDNEVLSLRREIEELKALVRGLCAKKDVEPSFDQENVPTVDQHNSFKASCSIQEKQHRVPPTMSVDSQECKLYIFNELHGGQLLVAFGRAWLESLPIDTVHEIPLGKGNVRVSINMSKLKKTALPIPTYEVTTVEEAVNGFVAWPKTLVELDTSMNNASQGPSHVPNQAAEGNKGQKKLRKKNDQFSN